MVEKAQLEVLQDITQAFSFVDQSLVYMDAPWEGFLRSTTNGDLFAFRVSEIVTDTLWHWTLLPVPTLERTVDEVFTSARAEPPKPWLSIVEDRRGAEPRLSATWLSSSLKSVAERSVRPQKSRSKP